ncbi:hypothetical protein J2P12_06585 [Candidatus Bathyarchaeota archaeon]|nr:hypothetical protein [Candidatus Bathyarchaeota archaeon]
MVESLGRGGGMTNRSEMADRQNGDNETELLAAIYEFKSYLLNVSKDLARVKKRSSQREIRESAALAESGISEALNYLAIVKKVIDTTQRVLDRRLLDENKEPVPVHSTSRQATT